MVILIFIATNIGVSHYDNINCVFLKILTSLVCYGTMALCNRERLKIPYKHAQKNWTTIMGGAATSCGSTGVTSTYQQNSTTCAIIFPSTELANPKVTALRATTMCSVALKSSFYIISSLPSMLMVGSSCYKYVAIKVSKVFVKRLVVRMRMSIYNYK